MQQIEPTHGSQNKMSRFSLKSLALAIFISVAGLTAAPANTQDWSATATQSSRGGHIMGNPEAKTQIVEYASYTCPHCGDFEVDAVPELKTEYIANGTASLEIRNYVRDPIDLTVSLLARCGGPEKFFANHRLLMETQSTWRPREANLRAATRALLDGPYADAAAEKSAKKAFMLNAFADMDLASVAKDMGLTSAEARRCIADPVAYDMVNAMTEEAVNSYGFPGTPSFMINGLAEHDVYDIKTLKARLSAVIK